MGAKSISDVALHYVLWSVFTEPRNNPPGRRRTFEKAQDKLSWHLIALDF